MAAEILPGTITLKTAFYRYYERRFGESYVWPFDLPIHETEGGRAQRDQMIETINSRDAHVCQELKQAFLDGELRLIVYRSTGAGAGITELDRDGWRNGFSIGLFKGSPIQADETWPKAKGEIWGSALNLTPTVDEPAFEKWLDGKLGKAPRENKPRNRSTSDPRQAWDSACRRLEARVAEWRSGRGPRLSRKEVESLLSQEFGMKSPMARAVWLEKAPEEWRRVGRPTGPSK